MTENPLGLSFVNRFTRDLPADPVAENTRRQVEGACFSRVAPSPTNAPVLIAHASEVAELLGISPDDVASSAFTRIFSGNLVTDDMDPYAMCYGGHQFGNWAGQLGDGRAIALGEIQAPDGSFQTLQLKGAGPTPYSRSGDGMAVLRSSIREFLCSEAMFHLGVPTTRALSLVGTGNQVMRDMFYDGNPALEHGAVVCRVAPSFLRFGNFQLFPSRGDSDSLRHLVEWTIRTDFAHLVPSGTGDSSDTDSIDTEIALDVITEWFAEIVRTTAELMVHWMRIGFVHGVMNTDNLSILGLTIDYGPYGWLEGFDPNWTPNTTDAGGRRYRYGNQPSVAHWNLMQLANAIASLYDEDEIPPLQAALDTFATLFGDGWNAMMASRLGFAQYEGDADSDLFGELGRILQLHETDMTIFHRSLIDIDVDAVTTLDDDAAVVAPIAQAWYDAITAPTDDTISQTATWIRTWAARVRADAAQPNAASTEERLATMRAVNPKYVLRNWMAQLAIDKADEGDYSGVAELLELLRQPYAEQPEHESTWYVKRPEWARERAGCSMLSCSS